MRLTLFGGLKVNKIMRLLFPVPVDCTFHGVVCNFRFTFTVHFELSRAAEFSCATEMKMHALQEYLSLFEAHSGNREPY